MSYGVGTLARGGLVTSIGGFELETLVGRGASATVWRARTQGGAPVALKVLDEPPLADAFRRELAAVAGLDHPAIARVLDHGVVGNGESRGARGLRAGAPYIAMELAHGSLREWDATLGWSEVHRALVALLSALAHAHARGILHRDVKPGNLLVDGARSPYLLADFGLARVRALEVPAEPGLAERSLGPMIGTPSYMAPEQCEGPSADHGPWTDLYAVGGLAWTLVCGRPVFGHGLTAIHGHVHAAVPPLRPRFAVPPGFEAWLGRLLAKRPSERYARACDAARDLERLARAGGDGAVVRGRPEVAATPGVVGGGLRLLGLRELPFVGRADARARLWRDLLDVEAGGGPRAWLIEGPSGYGKSRLAQWVAESAHEQLGAEVLRATHSADPGPRDGLAPMVDEHLRCAGLSREAAIARAAARLAVSDADPVAVTLGELCCGHAGAGQMPVGQAIAAWIAALGAERPVVVWLDDVQWGAAAIRLMRTLLAGGSRALIVATVQREACAERPAERAEIARLAGAAHVERLEPLGEREHQALVQSVLALEPALARRLASRTAGNPLFAVHLVKDWAERGWLTEGPDGFGLSPEGDAAGAEPPLPGALAATWVARIDRLLAGLSAGASDGLELAAALGQTVDLAEWRAVAGSSASESLLLALIVAGLAASTPSTFAFAHGMVREAILARAAACGRLPAHHRRCADALAARASRSSSSAPPALWARVGRHTVAAGDLAGAVAPLSEAAMYAADQGSIELASGLADELASVLARLDVPRDDPRWAEVSITRSSVALLAADVPAARAAAAEAFPAAASARPERHVRALQLLGEVEHRFGRPADAVAWYDRAAAVAEAHGRPVLRNAIELSRLRMQLEQGPATPDLQARLVALLATDAVDRGNVLVSLGRVHLDLGQLDTAWSYTEQAMAEFRAAHRAEGTAGGLTLFGEIARFRGAWADAERFNLEARALFERLGSRTNLGILDLNLVQIAHEAGDLGEAHRRFVRLVDGDALDDGLGSLVHAIALLFHADAPDPAPFAHHLAEARAAWVRTGRWWSDAVLAGTRAAALAEAAGHADRAVAARSLVAAWRD